MPLPLLAAALVAAATPEAPVLLETLTLGVRPASYDINVPNCASFGKRLVRIQLREVGGWAHVASLRLTYADRRFRRISLARDLSPGEATPWIDLAVQGRGDSRCLAYLRLEGQSRNPRFLTQLQIFGQSETTAGH